MESKKILIIFVLVIFSLVFRELPYINVLVAGRLWIFYSLLLLFLIFPWKIHYLSLVFLSPFFLLVAFLLTLIKLYNFSEILGIAIYFFLWLAVIFKITKFKK